MNVFNTLTLKQIFWKTKSFFKKLEYLFLVERIKIKNASFPYKTAILEASVKANTMMSTKFVLVTATGLEPTTTYLVNEHSTIQATVECRFLLKHVRDMTRTYSQMHRTDKYPQLSSII